jgi:hypothetical protein
VHWRARRTRPRVEGPPCPSSSSSGHPGPDLKPRPCATSVSTARTYVLLRTHARRDRPAPETTHTHVPRSVPRRGCHRATAPPSRPRQGRHRQRPARGVGCNVCSAAGILSVAFLLNRALYGRSCRPSGVGRGKSSGFHLPAPPRPPSPTRLELTIWYRATSIHPGGCASAAMSSLPLALGGAVLGVRLPRGAPISQLQKSPNRAQTRLTTRLPVDFSVRSIICPATFPPVFTPRPITMPSTPSCPWHTHSTYSVATSARSTARQPGALRRATVHAAQHAQMRGDGERERVRPTNAHLEMCVLYVQPGFRRRTTTRLKLKRLRIGKATVSVPRSRPRPRPRHAIARHAPTPRARGVGQSAAKPVASQKPNRRSAWSLRGAPGDPCDLACPLALAFRRTIRAVGATFWSGDWWYGCRAHRRCEQDDERRAVT